jgi:hypothetical protein
MSGCLPSPHESHLPKFEDALYVQPIARYLTLIHDSDIVIDT